MQPGDDASRGVDLGPGRAAGARRRRTSGPTAPRRGRTPPRPGRGRRGGAGCRRPRRTPAAAFGRWLPSSSSHAWLASRSASAERPRRSSTTARWIRQIPGKIANGCCSRPPCRRLGPLGGSAQVADVLAGADQAAVHLARRVRAEPALDGEEHGLVEVREPCLDLARVDEHAADRLQRLRLEVGDRSSRPSASARSASSTRRVEPPPPWASSASRSSSAPCSTHSGSSSSARRARCSHPAGDRRPGPHAVVLVEPHRALAGAPAVAELVEDAVRAAGGPRCTRRGGRATTAPRRARRAARPRQPGRRAGRPRRGATHASQSWRARASRRASSASTRLARHGGDGSREPVRAALRPTASWAARCSSTGWISAVGLNSKNVTPSSVQPVCPPGQ